MENLSTETSNDMERVRSSETSRSRGSKSSLPEGMPLADMIKLDAAFPKAQTSEETATFKEQKVLPVTLKESKLGPHSKVHVLSTPHRKHSAKGIKRKTYSDSDSHQSQRRTSGDHQKLSSELTLADRIKAKRKTITDLSRTSSTQASSRQSSYEQITNAELTHSGRPMDSTNLMNQDRNQNFDGGICNNMEYKIKSDQIIQSVDDLEQSADTPKKCESEKKIETVNGIQIDKRDMKNAEVLTVNNGTRENNMKDAGLVNETNYSESIKMESVAKQGMVQREVETNDVDKNELEVMPLIDGSSIDQQNLVSVRSVEDADIEYLKEDGAVDSIQVIKVENHNKVDVDISSTKAKLEKHDKKEVMLVPPKEQVEKFKTKYDVPLSANDTRQHNKDVLDSDLLESESRVANGVTKGVKLSPPIEVSNHNSKVDSKSVYEQHPDQKKRKEKESGIIKASDTELMKTLDLLCADHNYIEITAVTSDVKDDEVKAYRNMTVTQNNEDVKYSKDDKISDSNCNLSKQERDVNDKQKEDTHEKLTEVKVLPPEQPNSSLNPSVISNEKLDHQENIIIIGGEENDCTKNKKDFAIENEMNFKTTPDIENGIPESTEKSAGVDRADNKHTGEDVVKRRIESDIKKDTKLKTLLRSLRTHIDDENQLRQGLLTELKDFHNSSLVKFSQVVKEARCIAGIEDKLKRKGKRVSSFRSLKQIPRNDSTGKKFNSSIDKIVRFSKSESDIHNSVESDVDKKVDENKVGVENRSECNDKDSDDIVQLDVKDSVSKSGKKSSNAFDKSDDDFRTEENSMDKIERYDVINDKVETVAIETTTMALVSNETLKQNENSSCIADESEINLNSEQLVPDKSDSENETISSTSQVIDIRLNNEGNLKDGKVEENCIYEEEGEKSLCLTEHSGNGSSCKETINADGSLIENKDSVRRKAPGTTAERDLKCTNNETESIEEQVSISKGLVSEYQKHQRNNEKSKGNRDHLTCEESVENKDTSDEMLNESKTCVNKTKTQKENTEQNQEVALVDNCFNEKKHSNGNQNKQQKDNFDIDSEYRLLVTNISRSSLDNDSNQEMQSIEENELVINFEGKSDMKNKNEKYPELVVQNSQASLRMDTIQFTGEDEYLAQNISTSGQSQPDQDLNIRNEERYENEHENRFQSNLDYIVEEEYRCQKNTTQFIYPEDTPKTPNFYNIGAIKRSHMHDRRNSASQNSTFSAAPVNLRTGFGRNSTLSNHLKTNSAQRVNGILKLQSYETSVPISKDEKMLPPGVLNERDFSDCPKMQKRKLRKRKGSSSISFSDIETGDKHSKSHLQYIRLKLQENYLEETYDCTLIDKLNREAFDMSEQSQYSVYELESSNIKLPPLPTHFSRETIIDNEDNEEKNGRYSVNADRKPLGQNASREKERSFFYITPKKMNEMTKAISRVDEILKELSIIRREYLSSNRGIKHYITDFRSTLQLKANQESRVDFSIDHPRFIYDKKENMFRTSRNSYIPSCFNSAKCSDVFDTLQKTKHQRSKALGALKKKLKDKKLAVR